MQIILIYPKSGATSRAGGLEVEKVFEIAGKRGAKIFEKIRKGPGSYFAWCKVRGTPYNIAKHLAQTLILASII